MWIEGEQQDFQLENAQQIEQCENYDYLAMQIINNGTLHETKQEYPWQESYLASK